MRQSVSLNNLSISCGLNTMHFDVIRRVQLEQVAAELYSDQMPYHNFNHVLRTLAAGQVLVERCLREGVPINGEVVYCALLFHDGVKRMGPSRRFSMITSMQERRSPRWSRALTSAFAQMSVGPTG